MLNSILLVLMVSGILLVVSCTPSSKSSDSNEESVAHSCTEPENPYDAGTGHYAGYEWAENHGSGTCSASSESFNEGCEEYETQESEYQECEAQKKH
jgi:hypothetical protein